jgi:hypothetical protein
MLLGAARVEPAAARTMVEMVVNFILNDDDVVVVVRLERVVVLIVLRRWFETIEEDVDVVVDDIRSQDIPVPFMSVPSH